MTLTRQKKADILTACVIAVGLPGYYKVRLFLEGQATVKELIRPAALVEVFYALVLALLLIATYRCGAMVIHRLGGRWWRRTLPLLMVAAAAAVAIAFTRFFFNVVVPWGTAASFEFDIVVLAIVLPLLVSGVADRIFLEGQTRAAEQAVINARFETLKARLSPHFLFNSLNTVTDLIEEDPKLAVRFIEEMAAIYRYILAHRDEPLVPLDAEIEAIRSLIHLLETRQPGAFDVEFELAPGTDTLRIVPLALQTVIENALKHNIYSACAPMTLKIFTDGDALVVENTLNRRANVSSTASGLENLRARVQHACGKSLQIHEYSERFAVRVPLVSTP